MPQINGRSLEQVRRYDLFKLAVAVLLFIAWLFFTDRMPMAPTGPGDAAASAQAPTAASATTPPATTVTALALARLVVVAAITVVARVLARGVG